MKILFSYLVLELRLFFTCLAFLTRIPIPRWVAFEENWLHRSIKYSPLVGILLGTIQFIVYILLVGIFGNLVSFIFSIGVLLILTGSFHEDGFADFCDGIGGGWKRDDILRIMKDSRVGSFAAVGLIIIMSLKVFGAEESLKNPTSDLIIQLHNGFKVQSFESLQSTIIPIWLQFVVAHSFSRFLSIGFMLVLPYAKEEGYAKPMAKEISLPQLCFAAMPGLVPFIFFCILAPKFTLSLVVILPSLYYMYRLMKRWIQGFTGDCLGAVQQVAETGIWISGVFVWNFI
ncbi:adenosylcobinamide-GDP ribazoletransferase [Leptospira sp. 96542]|nr:adenosylcobinamide-GDP ribazoletransferase [Leptospira sp. 96542]